MSGGITNLPPQLHSKGLIQMVLDIILIALLTICLYTDIKFKKIYNKYLVPAVVLALAINLYFGGFEGALESIKGLLLGMGLLFIPFALGGMGAGDVKLMGVVGALKGPEFVWVAFLASAMAGGILAIGEMLKSGQLKQRLLSIWYTLLSLIGIVPRINLLGTLQDIRPYKAVPYGAAITIGTVITYFVMR
jgi:prepilin peptidase CpaA